MPCDRQRLLKDLSVRHLDTREGPTKEEVIDLIGCSGTGKISCFVLLRWKNDRLLLADLYFTEAEARACLAHGMTCDLRDFALPSEVLAVM